MAPDLPPIPDPDPDTGTVPFEGFDRALHAILGRATRAVSPTSLLLAYTDWMSHLLLSPAKQAHLVQKALRKAHRLASYLPGAISGHSEPCIEPLEQDRRFNHPDWQRFPFNAIYQSFLLAQQWWYNATTEVRGVSRHNEEIVTFVARQLLDIFSPSNFPLTNPEVLRQTFETGGLNLYQGFANWVEDFQRIQSGRRPAGAEAFRVGENVATTPGKVVFRNRLIELIQYAPATEKVRPEPVLVVPAWIMKYYILDLSAHNSLIRHLVEAGHTVFCISWKNPAAAERDRGMEDYLRMGMMDALDVVSAVVPGQKIHGVGYCLGGTLASIGAAAMARDDDDRLASLSLLASQTDFTEPGELGLFIDESELTFLEEIMFDRGYLSAGQMAGAFELLRSNDLFWSRLVREYLMGDRRPMSDLMAWNADATRMPYRMHSEYLRRLYLQNDLAEGRYRVGGKPIALNDLRVPVFCVGTANDHVAPWRSVYKLHLLTDTEITFVLAGGGHNTGIVSEPGGRNRGYRVMTRRYDGKYVDPDAYLALAEQKDGSWWPDWHRWLASRSGEPVPPPAYGTPASGHAPLADAPGMYVLEK
ncbi:MAG TPA: alpha/beta fold hydrolase [Burkholderiales bacterium]|nr:alpha/beta fold hydrolase [Burkholderiales bacterium]